MDASAVAARVGAQDIFVLRRVSPERLFNVGGHGRGAGWAGNVSIEPAFEPWIAASLDGGVNRRRSGVPFRAFGPYWATTVVAVSIPDGLVVFGGDEVAEVSDEDLVAAASELATLPSEIPVEKMRADEAEVQQAIEELLSLQTDDLGAAAGHLATTTAKALSCEFAAVLLHGPPTRVHQADEGWKPPASEDEVIAALMPLAQVVRNGMLVEQDLSQSAFPYRPLAFDDGLVARCVVPLGEEGSLGLLVAAHAGSTPRGFTSLCQRVASEIAGAGGPILADLVRL